MASNDPFIQGRDKFNQACSAQRSGASFSEQVRPLLDSAIALLRTCTPGGSGDLDPRGRERALLGLVHTDYAASLKSEGDSCWAVALWHCEKAMEAFPHATEARVCAAELLFLMADDTAALQRGEEYLVSALKSSVELQQDKSMVLLTARRREAPFAAMARSKLAMHFCQTGRQAEADAVLAELGYTHRLAPCVLYYPIASAAAPVPTEDPGRFVAVVDGALPVPVLKQLRVAFGRESVFWREHQYGPKRGYFSYTHALKDCDTLDGRGAGMKQLIKWVHRIAQQHFPQVAEACFAEWWAHCRPHSSGHQLHFDSADEGEGGVRNPIISVVLYLSGDGSGSEEQQGEAAYSKHAIGGPTLVTDQTLRGPLATKGWLSHPRLNRLAMFDGTMLHAVVPGHGPSPTTNGRRITLMIAFWQKFEIRKESQPGAGRPFPSASATQHIWPQYFDMPQEANPWVFPCEDKWSTTPVAPFPLDTIWASIAGSTCASTDPTYDQCFQGF